MNNNQKGCGDGFLGNAESFGRLRLGEFLVKKKASRRPEK